MKMNEKQLRIVRAASELNKKMRFLPSVEMVASEIGETPKHVRYHLSHLISAMHIPNGEGDRINWTSLLGKLIGMFDNNSVTATSPEPNVVFTEEQLKIVQSIIALKTNNPQVTVANIAADTKLQMGNIYQHLRAILKKLGLPKHSRYKHTWVEEIDSIYEKVSPNIIAYAANTEANKEIVPTVADNEATIQIGLIRFSEIYEIASGVKGVSATIKMDDGKFSISSIASNVYSTKGDIDKAIQFFRTIADVLEEHESSIPLDLRRI